MPRRLTPQEKKRMEYDRDRYVDAEYPHLLRKRWPKKKAAVSRRDRRRGERLVAELRNRPADEVVDAGDEAGITARAAHRTLTPHALRKSGVKTVRERLADRAESRQRKTGFNFFREPYDAARHQKPFAAYLASIVAGPPSGDGSRARAAHLARVLDPTPMDPRTDRWRETRRLWMHAFFRDEPEWDARLRAWIDACLADAG
jgi:hypothetical protein